MRKTRRIAHRKLSVDSLEDRRLLAGDFCPPGEMPDDPVENSEPAPPHVDPVPSAGLRFELAGEGGEYFTGGFFEIGVDGSGHILNGGDIIERVTHFTLVDDANESSLTLHTESGNSHYFEFIDGGNAVVDEAGNVWQFSPSNTTEPVDPPGEPFEPPPGPPMEPIPEEDDFGDVPSDALDLNFEGAAHIDGFINFENDVDYFTFQVADPTTINAVAFPIDQDIFFNPDGSAPDGVTIELHDEEGEVLGSSNAFEELHTELRPGSYFIAVTSATPQPYLLEVLDLREPIDPPVDPPIDPPVDRTLTIGPDELGTDPHANEIGPEATLLEATQEWVTIDSFIDTVDDVDVFQFHLEENSHLFATITPRDDFHEFLPIEDFENGALRLIVSDQDGNQIAENEVGPDAMESFLFADLQPGLYFVSTSTTLEDAPIPYILGLGTDPADPIQPPIDPPFNPFTPDSNIGDDQHADEVGPDATVLPEAFATITSHIDTNDDVDVFQFTTERSGSVGLSGTVLNVTGDAVANESRNLRIQLLDADGNVTMMFGAEHYELQTHLDAGTYFLTVAADADGATTYHIGVHGFDLVDRIPVEPPIDPPIDPPVEPVDPDLPFVDPDDPTDPELGMPPELGEGNNGEGGAPATPSDGEDPGTNDGGQLGPDDSTFLTGDANRDGRVDSIDLGLLLNNFNEPSSPDWSRGNFNGDATVDSTDLGLLLNNFNSEQVAPTSASVVRESYDTNVDGVVSESDASHVLGQLGSTAADADVNGDGIVTPLDAVMVVNRFNQVKLSTKPEVADDGDEKESPRASLIDLVFASE